MSKRNRRREMRNRRLWIEDGSEAIMSDACAELRGQALRVLLIFHMKKHRVKVGKEGGKKKWVTENEGRLIFTYRDAEDDFGISPYQFRSAIDQLIAVGFLDITEAGTGVKRHASLYGLSDRWKLYGKKGFDERHRAKDMRGRGFQDKAISAAAREDILARRKAKTWTKEAGLE